MIAITGYMNLYQRGYFHHLGRPNSFDRYAGNIYPTLELALAEVDLGSHYVKTIEINWNEENMPSINRSDKRLDGNLSTMQKSESLSKTTKPADKNSVIGKVLSVLNKPS
jgi:hypothetical protein